MSRRLTEEGWLHGADPRKMVQAVGRFKNLRPTARKQILLACACSRLVWPEVNLKARELVGYYEECADDLSWLARVRSAHGEVERGKWNPASAVVRSIRTCNALATIDAVLAVPGVTP